MAGVSNGHGILGNWKGYAIANGIIKMIIK